MRPPAFRPLRETASAGTRHPLRPRSEELTPPKEAGVQTCALPISEDGPELESLRPLPVPCGRRHFGLSARQPALVLGIRFAQVLGTEGRAAPEAFESGLPLQQRAAQPAQESKDQAVLDGGDVGVP